MAPSPSIVFRPALWAIAPASSILWFLWVLSGLVSDRFEGYHDLYGVLLLAAGPAALWIFAFTPSATPHDEKSPGQASSVKAGLAGLSLWIGFAIWVYWAFSSKKIADFGQTGDSFGIINSLFLALGFFFTIRQLRHQEQSSTNSARLQAAPILMAREKELIESCISLRGTMRSLAEAFDDYRDNPSLYHPVDFLQTARDLNNVAASARPDRAPLMRELVTEAHSAIIALNNDAFLNPDPLLESWGEQAELIAFRLRDLITHLDSTEKEASRRSTDITKFIEDSFSGQLG